MHQQCDLITQYWGWINEIKAKGKEYKDHVETYNADILSWTKQMDELKNWRGRETSRLTYVEEKMIQEANIGI